MATDKKDLKKMFPHLYEELESGEVKVPIRGIRKNAAEAEAKSLTNAPATNTLKKKPTNTRKLLINFDISTRKSSISSAAATRKPKLKKSSLTWKRKAK